MSDEYDLSFKNKEVRIYLYLYIPAIIVTLILIYFDTQNYYFIPLFALLTIFYIWRYFYRKKFRKENVDT